MLKFIKKVFEVVFKPDYSLLDGAYSNNGWMQEFPDPNHKTHLGQRCARIIQNSLADLDIKMKTLLMLTAKNSSMDRSWHCRQNSCYHSRLRSYVVGPVGQNTGFNAYKLQPQLTHMGKS